MQNRIIKIGVTPSGNEWISLGDVKEWLIVDHNEDDTLITRLMTAVRMAFEKYTKTCLIDSTVVVMVDLKNPEFKFPRLPFKEINSIDIRKSDGSFTPLSTDEYTELGDSICFETLGVVRIDYDSIWTALPDDIKIAMFSEIAFRYTERGDKKGQSGLCETAEAYLLPYINMSYI